MNRAPDDHCVVEDDGISKLVLTVDSQWPTRHIDQREPIPLLFPTPRFISSGITLPSIHQKNDIHYFNGFTRVEKVGLVLALRGVSSSLINTVYRADG